MAFSKSLLVCAGTLVACSHAEDRPLNQSLPEAIEQIVRESGVPGLSVAVIEGFEITWAQGFGVLERGRAQVNTDTLFQAASISKPVAALGALLLVADEELGLDRNVNDDLDGWTLPDNDFTAEQKVTLRHLLSHTGGLTVHGFPGYPAGGELPSLHQVLDGSGIANTSEIRVDTVPGTLWRYSGGGYCIVQDLVIVASGQDFPEYMQTAVLEPLGMGRSTYAQPLAEDRHDNAARAHRRNGRVIDVPWHVYPELAAAGLWTTPTDLGRFLLALRDSWAGEDGAILSPPLAREMLTPQFESSYGLGPALGGEGETAYFGHGGSNEGFRCQARLYLHSGEGAVVMVNSGDNSVVQQVMERIGEIQNW